MESRCTGTGEWDPSDTVAVTTGTCFPVAVQTLDALPSCGKVRHHTTLLYSLKAHPNIMRYYNTPGLPYCSGTLIHYSCLLRACLRYLLTDVLRVELGFKGVVVSDWAAIQLLPGNFSEQVCPCI